MLVTLAWVAAARASSCCAVSGAVLPGVLQPGERVGVAVGASVARWMGDWGAAGDLLGTGPVERHAARADARVLVRVAEPVQLMVGGRVRAERIDGVSAVEAGDPGAAAVLEDRGVTARWTPSVAGDVRPVLHVGWGVGEVGGSVTTLYGGVEARRRGGAWAAGGGLSRDAVSVRADARGTVGWTVGGGQDVLVSGRLSVAQDRVGVVVVPEVGVSAPRNVGTRVRVVPSVALAPPVPGLGRRAPAWVTVGLGAVAVRR
ncbi:MAG: hypothetical protein RLZZ299_1953 [Pseudomonadota bacterium]|jgi:hypothetical protein